ncbi:hypothetical protein [Vibrio sp. PNB22_4_1]|uniref:hypothetical protein n=1 Tax=unclassified Vibrio TaxID=2614977 RepID=UPI00406A7DD6
MKTSEQIIFELLDIYPKLIEAKGFIFFGTLEEKPPYHMATYRSWRLTHKETAEYTKARNVIGDLLDSLLENISTLSPRPHGYLKIKNERVSLHWTTRDIVDTMLDNIENASKLDRHDLS